MLSIRLQRVGRTNIKTFRIVVTESSNSAKSNRSKEILGIYDPVYNKKEVDIERAKYWLSVGAQPSITLRNFFIDQKIMTGKKINALPKKTPLKKDAPKVEAKPATPAPTPVAETPATV